MVFEGVGVLDDFLQDDVYKQFLTDDFDVKIVTSSAVKNVAITENLAKLSNGISLLDKELHNQVANHYEDLLSQATEIETLEGVLLAVHNTIHLLLTSAEKLRNKIVVPYEEAANQTNMLTRLQVTCDLLRRVIRISQLCRRLEGQLHGKTAEITKAALCLNELDYLLEGTDLSGLDIIHSDLHFIKKAHEQINVQAKALLQKGLETQNQNTVATALQVFHHLHILTPTVQQIMQQTKDNICQCIQQVLDVRLLSQSPQDASQKITAPGRAIMPMTGSASAFRANLWTNMEHLMNEICSTCKQIQHLEKVLIKKKAPNGHTYFQDVITAQGESSITEDLWQSITGMLTENFSKSANASTFLKQAFEVEYPKLLRMFMDLLKKLQQFNNSLIDDENEFAVIACEDFGKGMLFMPTEVQKSPEKALRKALDPFEKAYLARCLSRLMDSVNVAYSLEMHDTPTTEDIEGILNAIKSELSAASIDFILLEKVAKNVADTVHYLVEKNLYLVSNDYDAVQIIDSPNSKQLVNAKVVHLLYLIALQITKYLNSDYFNEQSKTVISSSLQAVESVMKDAVEPLLTSIASGIEEIIITMHKEDFSMPAVNNNERNREAQCSLFMEELRTFINRAETDYLSLYPDCEVVLKGVEHLASRTIELFVRHASLVRPLGDGGKMRLAADCAQMELAVVPFCHRVGDLGKSYRLLRSFRPLLFQTPVHIAQSPSVGEVVPYSYALHFLFSKAPQELRSPYEVAGWSVHEYSQWLDEHPSEKERLTLIKGTLETYIMHVKQKQDKVFCSVYPVMVELLQNGIQSQ